MQPLTWDSIAERGA